MEMKATQIPKPAPRGLGVSYGPQNVFCHGEGRGVCTPHLEYCTE